MTEIRPLIETKKLDNMTVITGLAIVAVLFAVSGYAIYYGISTHSNTILSVLSIIGGSIIIGFILLSFMRQYIKK